MKTLNLDYFKSRDVQGSSFLSSVGFDKSNNEICERMICDNNDCNCVGWWYVGDPSKVEKWIDRPKEPLITVNVLRLE